MKKTNAGAAHGEELQLRDPNKLQNTKQHAQRHNVTA